MSSASHRMNVLFMPEGSVLAHVGRALAISDALRAHQVKVCFAASGEHSSRLADAGHDLVPVYTLPRAELLVRLRTGGSAFEEADLDRYVNDEIRLLSELRPDVVVGDFRPSLGISAAHVGIPYACVINAVWTRYYAFPLDPPDSWLPTRLFGKALLRGLRPLLEKSVFAHYAKPFDTVRRRYGLPELRDIRDCMCSEDLNLVADEPRIFPSRGLPANFRYVGPVLWEPSVPDPPWLEELDPDLQTVYLTMGSTGPLKEIKGIARGLLDMGLQVVCTTTTQRSALWPAERRLHAVQYAPGGKLCELADVVVCHAGNGTIYQALSRGTPVVGIPEFHDQEFNMQRIEALGLGCRAGSGADITREVVAAVKEILSDTSYSDRAAHIRGVLRGSDAPGQAAQAIARFAGARRAAPGAAERACHQQQPGASEAHRPQDCSQRP